MWKNAVYFVMFLMLSYSGLAIEIPTQKVVLRGVDKVTGRVSTMQTDVGSRITFGALTVSVEKCYTRSPEETPENSSFLVVTERLSDGSSKDIFTGWMFSSNPALSAMEHPVYDIWVISCKNDENKNTQILDEQRMVLENMEPEKISESKELLPLED